MTLEQSDVGLGEVGVNSDGLLAVLLRTRKVLNKNISLSAVRM